MKVLILKPSSLGDVVQALPVLRLLKQHLPHSQIHWWLESGLVPLLEGDPDLAGIIPFERRRWSSPWHWDEAWRSLRRIRAEGFDWVIDLQSLARSGLVAWLANGQRTVGARAFYDIIVPRPSYNTHAVDWYLGVLPPLGVPVHNRFEWLPERPAAARAIRERWPADGARWIALQPGARWLNKRWPVEHFAAVTRGMLARHPDLRLAILGGASDRALGQEIARVDQARCVDLTGQTSLLETVEWIRRCQVMVTNDTGPMHVAAALSRPVIGLFGPTDPRRTGPYGQVGPALRAELECAPCMKSSCAYAQPLECLRAISPARVIARLEEHLTPRTA